MRQQVIGGVDVERTDATNDRAPPSPLNDLAEGSGDVAQRVPAPRRRFTNGTRRTNVHLTSGFDATNNDPGMRFGHLSGAYGSLSEMAQAITNSLNAPVPAPPVPRRNIIDIARDHSELNNLLEGAGDDSSREIYRTLLRALAAEAQSFGSNNQSNNDTADSNENASIAQNP